MRASRLLSILILLQLRVRLTAEALAREYEVSVRTIYRDIDALSAAGIPVYGDRGPGGGFQLLGGYRTRLTGLAADEAEAMVMIGMPGPAAALGLGGAAARARGKLLASLTPAGSAEAGRMAARFHIDPADWYREDDDVPHLPALARAVLDRRAVAMTYDSWTGVRDWTIEPLGLVLKAGAWYVVARGAGKERIFRVSNMSGVAVQDAHFDRPEDFDLAAWWRTELARFEKDLRSGNAQLRASPEGLKRIAALGAYAAAAVKAAEAPGADGWARLALPIETVEQAALMLLGVGPEVEIVGPRVLRAQLRTLAHMVVDRCD
jgi:predicted DNA-binding transcriptional regulator YafY